MSYKTTSLKKERRGKEPRSFGHTFIHFIHSSLSFSFPPTSFPLSLSILSSFVSLVFPPTLFPQSLLFSLSSLSRSIATLMSLVESHAQPAANTGDKDDLRLLVVSNRLPVTITKNADGIYEYKMSSGGLVSALSGLKRMMKFKWIGWPGIYIPEEDRALVQKELLEKHSCLPVFIDDDIADMHYNGFSNRYCFAGTSLCGSTVNFPICCRWLNNS